MCPNINLRCFSESMDLLKNSDGVTLHEFLFKIVTEKSMLPSVIKTRGVFVLLELYVILKKLNLAPEDELVSA